MTKLILSSSNIMGGASSVVRRATQKSNIEFTASLQANFSTAQHLALHQQQQHHHHHHKNDNSNTNGDAKKHNHERPPYTLWTGREDSTIYIPAHDFSHPGLAEERSQYEITVKLFFLPNKPASHRCAQTREAIKLVLEELKVPSMDLLIVSFPGIAFDAEDEEYDEDNQNSEMNGMKAPQNPTEAVLGDDASLEDIDTQIETWACLEQLHDEGVIERLGLSEFGTDRLTKFLAKTRVRPSVNQINVRDCCVVPKPLILFAKKQNIELLTHNDCTNILPKGTLRELLGQGESGAGILSESEGDGGLKGDIEPQWVIKYTAVVKDRGVIENKGYFAAADLHEE